MAEFLLFGAGNSLINSTANNVKQLTTWLFLCILAFVCVWDGKSWPWGCVERRQWYQRQRHWLWVYLTSSNPCRADNFLFSIHSVNNMKESKWIVLYFVYPFSLQTSVSEVKYSPCIEMFKIFIMALNPLHMYSNEGDWADQVTHLWWFQICSPFLHKNISALQMFNVIYLMLFLLL